MQMRSESLSVCYTHMMNGCSLVVWEAANNFDMRSLCFDEIHHDLNLESQDRSEKSCVVLLQQCRVAFKR